MVKFVTAVALVTAVVQIPSLTWELPNAMGKKKTKKRYLNLTTSPQPHCPHPVPDTTVFHLDRCSGTWAPRFTLCPSQSDL